MSKIHKLKTMQGTEDDPQRWLVVVDGPKQYLVATIENGVPGDTLETEAKTAHLFSAAPELLKACISYRRHLWECYHSGMSMEQFDAHEDVVEVDAAINKAKGTS